jgi:hypothetical protein
MKLCYLAWFLRGFVIGAPLLLAANLRAQTTVTFTGGDAGQGLSLDPSRVLFAFNVYASATVTTPNITVQGVSFTPLALGYNDNFFAQTPNAEPFPGENSVDDLALRSLLQTQGWDDGGSAPLQYTFSGLVANGTYHFDVLQYTGAFAEREQAIVVNGSLVTLVPISFSVAKNTYFDTTADGSGNITLLVTQSGPYGGTGNQDGAIINGIVLSSVPEPASYGVLAGAAVLGLAWCGRRRSASGK